MQFLNYNMLCGTMGFLFTLQLINCGNIEYEVEDGKFAEISDIDKEQSQARYDPRLLSEDITGYHSLSGVGGPSSCLNSRVRYLHGEKISRADPCEICLCVDGEIFCWWKKCEHHLRKPPKKPKHRNHRKVQNAWHKGFPKSVVNFPKHFPTHLINENVDIEKQSNNTVVLTKTSASPNVVNKIDSPSSTIPENVFNSNFYVTGTNEPNEHQTSNDMNDKLRTITANPIVVDNKITTEMHNSNDGKGYYEKTIINKNGVFIENIRKIANIDENAVVTKEINDMENDNINRKRIELMNVPLSQHYVITSSGKIEKTDALASEDVITQFRDGLNDFQTSSGPRILNTMDVKGKHYTETNALLSTVTDENRHIECIVMGNTYKVGTILPQETGNCLQCVCTEDNVGDSPRVTCSPHNCPPLILPDLFDATGY